MRDRSVLVLLAALSAAACAKVVVVPVGKHKAGAEGVFYALPKTVVRTHLKVDRTVRASAPYDRFAAIFAPGGKVVCKEKEDKPEDQCVTDSSAADPRRKNTRYAVQEGATFSTFGEPDPENVYLVQFTGGGALDQALAMSWTEMGVLSTASASVTNRTADVALAGLKTVAGLGTKLAFGASEVGTEGETRPCDDSSANDLWILAVLKEHGGGSKHTLTGNYCDIPAKTRETSFGEARDRALLRRATQAYVARVHPLADARTTLLTTGTSSLDPVALVNKLEPLIDEQLKALYLGTTTTKTWEGAFDLRTLEIEKPIRAFGIVADKGVCIDKNLLAPDVKAFPDGFKVLDDNLPAEKEHCLKATPVELTLAFHPGAAQQLFEKVKAANPASDGERSFRYRVPAQVKARVATKDDTHGIGVFSVAQLGPVVSLPAGRRSKSLSYELAMIEATGGLKTFKLGTTGGLDAATIEALGGVGGTVIDAREAARARAATAADELTQLTREHTLLKLRDEICQIQRRNGIACAVQP